MGRATKVAVVDNVDSFVYNLVQYLGELGAEPVVFRSDRADLADVEAAEPDAVLISPGPGRPEAAALANAVLARYAGEVPVLGVCLGHQCIAVHYGASVVRADEVVHGRASLVHHDGTGVFAGLPEPIEATRYHSLAVDPATVPPALSVTARTDDGVIMGLRHVEVDVEGVQFHPESVLTESGHDLLATFLARAR